MSFRPKSENRTTHITIDELKGVIQARTESTGVQNAGDSALIEEMKKRGYKIESTRPRL